METMLEATARLQQSGYKLDLTALAGARIHCSACDAAIDAHEATVEETVRFEGDSNPADEQILLALALPCTHHGLYRAAFGPDTPADDVEVLRAIADTTG